MLGFLFADEVDYDEADVAKVLDDEGLKVVAAARDALGALDDWTTEAIDEALRAALVEGLGLKPRNAFGPVRVAVTGRRVSPPLFESLELLGREESLARLDAAPGRGRAVLMSYPSLPAAALLGVPAAAATAAAVRARRAPAGRTRTRSRGSTRRCCAPGTTPGGSRSSASCSAVGGLLRRCRSLLIAGAGRSASSSTVGPARSPTGSRAPASVDTVTPASMLYLNLVARLADAGRLVRRPRRPPACVRAGCPRCCPGMRWKFFFACLGLAVIALVASLDRRRAAARTTPTTCPAPPHLPTGQLLATAIVILFTTPLQAIGEEYGFRGYLMQAFGSFFDGVAEG